MRNAILNIQKVTLIPIDDKTGSADTTKKMEFTPVVSKKGEVVLKFGG